MPFNLEQFKSGTPAYTRDGRKATFVGICEDCRKDSQLVVNLSDSGTPDSYYLSGEVSNAFTSNSDLVSMQNSFEHIKSGDPVMVWSADAHPLKAKLRLFVAPEELGGSIEAKVQHHLYTGIYPNCLPVQEYIDTYLK